MQKNNQLIIEIKEIFEKVTEINIQNLDPNEDFREATGVNSVVFVGFLSQIEKEFNIELPMSILESKTLNDFMTVFQKHYIPKNA